MFTCPARPILIHLKKLQTCNKTVCWEYAAKNSLTNLSLTFPYSEVKLLEEFHKEIVTTK